MIISPGPSHPLGILMVRHNVVVVRDQYQKLIDEHALDAERPLPDISFMGQLGPTLTLTNFRNVACAPFEPG